MMDKIGQLLEKLPPGDQERLIAQLEEYKQAVERERCQDSFMAFVKKMWPGFIHGRHHAVLAKKFEDVAAGKIKRLAISLPPRHAILTSMKIPSLRGMVTMADLQVGDFVFGPDGKPIEVIGKSEVFSGRELYRVTTDDGASLVVDGEHLWTVRLDRKAKNWKDYTTEDLWMRQEGWVVKSTPHGKHKFFKGKSKDFRSPMIPSVMPVEYKHADLPVDPYVLGVWLGDGSKSSAVITCHDDDAVYTRSEIERRGYKTTDQSTRFTFGILDLQVKLRDLGVLKNKHIPREYLQSSVEQRRDLLKGLMDTDGNVSKAGQCFFAQSNRDFIEQVAELIRSLGIKANILESEAKIGDKSYGKTWKISFYANDVFNLPRKEERTLKTERKFGRYISIEKLNDVGDTQCIKVDREDGLFLAGDGYICTHNTKSEFGSYLFPAWFMGKFPHKKVMQASNTGELAVGFGRKVRNLVMSEQYAEVFPDVKLRQDSKAAGRWSTNHSGEYFAIGVGGTMTGRGADCLVGSTMVMTYNGLKRIDEVRPNEYVLSYCEITNRSVYRRVVAVARRQAFDTYQVHDRLGNMVEATGNHRIYYEGRWEPTEAIVAGGSVLSYMPDRFSAGAVRASEEVCGESELCSSLQLELRNPAEKLDGRHQVCGNMQKLRKGNVGQPIPSYGLFGLLSKGFGSQKGSKDQNCSGKKLCGLRSVIQAAKQYIRKQVLLHEVQERSSVNGDEGVEQSRMEGWGFFWSSKKQSAAGLSFGKATCSENGCGHVCGLQLTGQSGGASHQSQPYGQQICKSGDSLQVVPLQAPRIPEEQPQASFVSVVERVHHEEGVAVYDIEVEGTHNFFANGILVHNCVIIDDPHTESEAVQAAFQPEIYDKAYEWYTSGPRQRLQPNGAIIIIATRWSENDLIGRALKDAAERGKEDEWDVVEFPAILPSGNSLWPEFWSTEELLALKAELPPSKWNAQYMQRPTGEEGAIIKREWWNVWEKEDPPPCEFIIQAWDTAYTKSNRNDFSACTTWGIFHLNEDPNDVNIILLDRYMDRLEFPDLKERAKAMYKMWEPDSCIIEAKASGLPLIFELRQMGIPVSDFTPTRGKAGQSNDKIARLNSVADIFKSGKVWAPDTRWARELIDNAAAFPNAAHDDDIDTLIMALLKFRTGGFLRLQSDYEDNEPLFKPKRASYY